MNSKTDLNNFGLKLLLMLPSVQTQINSLTSGTSSSHNRIKTKDLSSVLIPLPKRGTELFDDLMNKAEQYEANSKKYNQLKLEMYQLKNHVFETVG